MWYPKRVPFFLPHFFPSIRWSLEAYESPQLALTFDDGPHPDSTLLLLELLKKYDVRATMFLLSEQATSHTSLVDVIKEDGHSIGAHGIRHINGWRTSTAMYVEAAMKSMCDLNTTLFRPPYGRLTYRQYRALINKADIIMWSSLTGDFDKNISSDHLRQNYKNIKAGDIVVCHDSPYAWHKSKETLSEFIEERLVSGYRFVTL